MTEKIEPTLEDLEKAELRAKIAKYEAEKRGMDLHNEAQFLEIQQFKLKAKENYIYTFYNPIVQPTVADCITTLGTWARKAKKGQELTIFLNSPGGTVSDGLGLYDYINAIKEDFPVKIKVFGAAYSMAAVLLQAGTVRAMQPNASLMIHPSSLQLEEGDIPSYEMEDMSKRASQINDKLYTLLAERANVSKSELKRRCNRKNAFIEAEEAAKLGLIDVIEN